MLRAQAQAQVRFYQNDKNMLHKKRKMNIFFKIDYSETSPKAFFRVDNGNLWTAGSSALYCIKRIPPGARAIHERGVRNMDTVLWPTKLLNTLSTSKFAR